MHCPSCGQSANAGDARCPACGRLLEPLEPASPVSQPFPQAFTAADPDPGLEPSSAEGAPVLRADVQPPPPAYAPAPGIPAYAAPPTVPLFGMPAYGPFPYSPYAPPSAPLPYSLPPGWIAPPPALPPPAWGMPPAPYGPMPYAPTQRHARTALIVGLALLVALIFTSGLGVAVYSAAYYAQHGAIPFVAPPLPTATPNSLRAFQDPLTSNASGWDVVKPYCQFADGGYEISNAICFAPAGVEVRDGSVSVQARQVAGPTLHGYGIVLRFASKGNYYAFNVASNGYWVFFKVVNDTAITIVDWIRSEAIHRGAGATNTLLVQFGHSHFDLFVNGVKVGQANDWAFAGGYTGLESYTDMRVVFNNFTIMSYP